MPPSSSMLQPKSQSSPQSSAIIEFEINLFPTSSKSSSKWTMTTISSLRSARASWIWNLSVPTIRRSQFSFILWKSYLHWTNLQSETRPSTVLKNWQKAKTTLSTNSTIFHLCKNSLPTKHRTLLELLPQRSFLSPTLTWLIKSRKSWEKYLKDLRLKKIVH